MKRLKMFVLVIFVLPFVLFGDELYYMGDRVLHKIPKETNTNGTSKKIIKTKKTPKSKTKQSVKDKPKLQDGIKEPSGFILGVGFVKGYCAFCGYETTANYITNNNEIYEFNSLNGLDILVGYKWFFGKRGGFGMRLYGNYDGHFVKDFNMHDIAINYDLLFNWVKTKPFKFGMILGLQHGINLEDYKQCEQCYKISFSTTGNIGFRFVIYDHSAIEILAQPRITISTTSYDYVYDGYNNPNTTNKNYSVISSFANLMIMGTLRFVYTF